jgi:hypothetical protein
MNTILAKLDKPWDDCKAECHLGMRRYMHCQFRPLGQHGVAVPKNLIVIGHSVTRSVGDPDSTWKYGRTN